MGLIKILKNTAYGMKLREKFYLRYSPEPRLRNLFEKAMKRYKECKVKKNPSDIRAEIHAYKKFWRCYPYDYFIYDLYRSDRPLTREEIINYIPDFFWYRLFLPHHTSYKCSPITDNKIITENFFNSLNIPQPTTLFRIINGNLYSPHMQRYTYNQIHHELADKYHEKIFVKPVESGGGQGIYIFHRNCSGSYTTHENLIFDEFFLSDIGKTKDYVIQSGVVQDQEISKIYPGSVNTCRIITENMDGKSRAVCGILRIGRSQNEIDNASAGGIFLKIDINTGKVGDRAMSYENEKFSEHPDTHFVFHNFEIPHWSEIRNLATLSASKLPFFTHLGWDIALTANGPLVIETNLSPGIGSLQISHDGLREKFGIDDPDYYWKNPGKRK